MFLVWGSNIGNWKSERKHNCDNPACKSRKCYYFLVDYRGQLPILGFCSKYCIGVVFAPHVERHEREVMVIREA